MESSSSAIAGFGGQRRSVSRTLRMLSGYDASFALTLPGDSERSRVEKFIADRFRLEHGAEISSYLPFLLTLTNGGEYTAALGINPARSEPLFLEQYLDHTAEQVIAGLCRTPVDRSRIVEIGNLVALRSGASALLYLTLLAIIHRAKFNWLMFTATPEVQRGIEKLGFTVVPICKADPSRLKEPVGDWGTYYESDPWVMAGFAGESMGACRSNPLLDGIVAGNREIINVLTDRLGANP